ncbi:MAG: 1,4-alpha-glucan branching protein GlgB, partial [Clostridiales bacterium]|nr:1,4-alpha-glucan branching protein GlgB [Clostridiales bacterium]
MGAHPVQQGGRSGWFFRVWAPKARAVSVIGSFNQWNREAAPMIPGEDGVWTCFIPGPQRYDSYKFSVRTREGHWVDKADPFAFHAETRPANASKLYALGGYSWGDEAWQSYCARHPYGSSPLN